MILISGVVLLTLKKPERRGGAPTTPGMAGSARSVGQSRRRSNSKQGLERGEGGGSEADGRESDETLWQVGDVSDDEDGGGFASGRSEGQRTPRRQLSPEVSRKPRQQQHPGEEGRGLIDDDEDEEEDEEHLHERSSPVPSLSSNTAAWRS